MKPADKPSDKQPSLEVLPPQENAGAMQARSETQPVAVPSVGQMLQAVIEKGVSNDNVAALEKLVDLYERMEIRDAEKAFNAAFVALQSALPVITASSTIPNRGRYEKFEDVMRQIAPMLRDNGFSVAFSMDVKDNRIVETCTLSHIKGHSRSNSFAVRTRKADSDTQADCMAATTAKRNALCNALNIVIRQDVLNEENDAGMEGDPNAKISKEQADQLEHRVKMTNSDVAAFLKFAGADKFSNILVSKYAMLDGSLKRKETAGR